MRIMPVFLIFVAVSLGCESSQSKQTKTSGTNNPAPASSVEWTITAEFKERDITWIVSSSGDLLYTRDGGGTWNKIDADTVGGFEMLSFVDENNGWAMSRLGKLWRTGNGGRNWNMLGDDSDPNSLSFIPAVDFKFIDRSHGWVLEPFQIWRTTDGGHTWQSYEPPTQEYYHFFSFFFLDPYEGWVGGEGGVVYHIEDGGKKWEEVKPGPEKNEASEEIEFRDVFFISKIVGWTNGLRGELFRTLDGGKNWRPLSFSIPGEDWHINSIHFFNRNEGWAVGWGPDNNVYENKGGIVLRTIDGGESWKEIDIKHNEASYELVHFSDSQNGWILSRRSAYRTIDGGKTWRDVLRLPQPSSQNN